MLRLPEPLGFSLRLACATAFTSVRIIISVCSQLSFVRKTLHKPSSLNVTAVFPHAALSVFKHKGLERYLYLMKLVPRSNPDRYNELLFDTLLAKVVEWPHKAQDVPP